MALTDLATGSGRLKTDLAVGVERWRERVLALSRSLHVHPEVAFEETASSATITELLAQGGFDVERGTGGLPTAFTATAGSGELTVALCVEYDALPEVVHACGHNLIAGASLASALALAPHVGELASRSRRSAPRPRSTVAARRCCSRQARSTEWGWP